MGPIESHGLVPLLLTLEVDLLVAAAVVVLVALALLWLMVRHQILLRRRGVFVCGLRADGGTHQGRWMVGLARYSRGTFLWYRPLNPFLSPSVVLRRGSMNLVEHHPPTADDGTAAMAGREVVTLATNLPGRLSRCQLVVDPGVLTGLMSWLEAGPPGGVDYLSIGR